MARTRLRTLSSRTDAMRPSSCHGGGCCLVARCRNVALLIVCLSITWKEYRGQGCSKEKCTLFLEGSNALSSILPSPTFTRCGEDTAVTVGMRRFASSCVSTRYAQPPCVSPSPFESWRFTRTSISRPDRLTSRSAQGQQILSASRDVTDISHRPRNWIGTFNMCLYICKSRATVMGFQ